MKANILNKHRVRTGAYASTDADGFNGFFYMILNGLPVKVIAGEGEGWRHVSVSINNSSATPSWSVMQQVKEFFWNDEDCVMQLHPPKISYVNTHPGCLHLWQPLTQPIPQPPIYMV